MTQEEKARAYDEALEKGRIFRDHLLETGDKGIAGEIEYIFPALSQSEDEQIRKALIEMVHDTTGDELWVDYNVHKEDALAWLEKQCYTKKDVDDAYLKGISDAKHELEKQGTPAKLSEEEQNRFAKVVLTSCALSFIDFLDAHKYEGKMCVSNGECEDIENAFHNAMWDRLHRYYCKYIEKQGEHKPFDSAKTCKDEQSDLTNFTEFEKALADVCRGWIGEEIGWKDYIIKNSLPLLEIAKRQLLQQGELIQPVF